MQKFIAASILLVMSCGFLCAQVPAPSPKKPDAPVTGIITGRVVNESGQPLVGASLFVRPINTLTTARTTTSDLDGNFRVSGLEPALYLVSGNAPAYTSIPSDGGPTYYRIGDTVRLELVRGGAITGTVTNSLGEPVIAVRVRAILVRDAKGEVPRVSVGSNEQQTDDRGVYRIYGLRPGTYIVSAGGPGFSPSFNPYDMDTPTFAPSSTRDTAAEVVVRSGDDSNIDIRYRGEPGHSISGTSKVNGSTNVSISLSQPGSAVAIANTVQGTDSRGFVFNGLPDGDYDLVAQEAISGPTATPPVISVSEPKRVTVKGADVTGVELLPRPLGMISGKIVMEPSKVPECEGKRAPLLTETVVRLQRPELDKPDPVQTRVFTTSASPDASGAFVMRNLVPGKYRFEPLFYARYWYVQSITTNAGGAKPQKIDAAANWTTVKSGEQLSNLTVTLAQGGASIRGRVASPDGAALPSTSVYLVPGEPEKADDVLRYFVSEVGPDLTFAFNSVPPGKYLALVDSPALTFAKLRQPESASTRTTIRRRAEAKKNAVELKPCQNLSDLQVKQ